jgi:hypothetical protein
MVSNLEDLYVELFARTRRGRRDASIGVAPPRP